MVPPCVPAAHRPAFPTARRRGPPSFGATMGPMAVSTTFDGRPGPTDTLGRAIRDLRISVTDRCNFRCTYCMPKEIFGRDYAFLPHDQVLTFEEIARVARSFVSLGVEKLRITGGEPLVRRDLPSLIAMLADIRRPDGGALDLTLTTNGSALRALAGPLVAAGLQRVTVSLDSLDDAVFGAMNGIDFPVARVLDGIDAAIEAGLAPVKVNMVVRRGVNEDSVIPMASWARETGVILRFIEYMDVGHSNGWRLDEVVPAGGSRRHDRGGLADRAGRAGLPWRGRRALAVRRRRRRVRGHLVGDPAVLPRLHARADLGRGQALHVPVRGRRSRPPRGPPLRGERRGPARTSSSRSGCAAAIAIPSCARRRPRRCPGSRCSRWAAEAARRPRRRGLLHSLSTGVDNSWMAPSRARRTSWITALTRPTRRPYRRSCPKGPTGSKDPRSHQGPSAPPPVASGASLPRRAAVSPRPTGVG